MIALVTTADRVKASAVAAALAAGGVACEIFDTAAGGLWGAAIPLRVMISDDDDARGRRLLREAGFVEAADGDWDLA